MIRLQGNFIVILYPKCFSIVVYFLSSSSVSVKFELVFLVYGSTPIVMKHMIGNYHPYFSRIKSYVVSNNRHILISRYTVLNV